MDSLCRSHIAASNRAAARTEGLERELRDLERQGVERRGKAVEQWEQLCKALGFTPGEMEAWRGSTARGQIDSIIARIHQLRRLELPAEAEQAPPSGEVLLIDPTIDPATLVQVGGAGQPFNVLLWRRGRIACLQVAGMHDSLRGRGVLHSDAGGRYVASMDHPWFAKGPTGVYLRGRETDRDMQLACEVFADEASARAYLLEAEAVLRETLAVLAAKGGAS